MESNQFPAVAVSRPPRPSGAPPEAAGEYHEADFDWDDLYARLRAAGAASASTSASAPAAAAMPGGADADDASCDDGPAAWDAFYRRHASVDFFKPKRYLVHAFAGALAISGLEPCGAGLGSTRPAVAADGAGGRRDGDGVPCSAAAAAPAPPYPPAALDILEMGAGCGAALLPLLRLNPAARGVALDYSAAAVDALKGAADVAGVGDRLRCAVADAAANAATFSTHVPPASADVALLVFTLSAVSPSRRAAVLSNCNAALRPGGRLCFRDYGLLDAASLRFPPAQRLAEGLFQRQDGTLAAVFSREEVAALLAGAGFMGVNLKYACVRQVNRRRPEASMDRVYLTGTARKPWS